MKDEIERRESYTAHVLDYFRARPNTWIDVHTLAYIGGFAAWRTRVSDARKTVKEDGGDIEWNGSVRQSAYRYVPRPERPEPAEAVAVNQPGLF
jgi:hypothetical protein